jgi:hypothetical protein
MLLSSSGKQKYCVEVSLCALGGRGLQRWIATLDVVLQHVTIIMTQCGGGVRELIGKIGNVGVQPLYLSMGNSSIMREYYSNKAVIGLPYFYNDIL